MPTNNLIFIYGPPGSGKSKLGRTLAEQLELPFYDLDHEIELDAGCPVPEIFRLEGEAGFRARETSCLRRLCARPAGVVALGGGALLAPTNRALAEEAGEVVCLGADPATLLQRIATQPAERPLLLHPDGPEAALAGLLEARREHYGSFTRWFDTTSCNAEAVAWEVQRSLGRFRVSGMGAGYDVRVLSGGLDLLGELLLERGLAGPVALVSDSQVGPYYIERAAASLAQAGYTVATHLIPAGEAHKTLETVSGLWETFLRGRLERGSTVVALGGGVVSDLAGFAASAYLRGVGWVAVPTSLLAMADAALGGKTGVDLPQGKNLVGAFHPPSLMLADPDVLVTLPHEELRSGLGEVVKHGVLADADLFGRCSQGWQAVSCPDWSETVRRAMAVKISYICADPYEKGVRAALNFGHSVGHALERASGYALRHGEAVAIGMVIEARLAERIGLAEAGLAETIAAALHTLGLPIHIPAGITTEDLLDGMQVDKKRAGGVVQLALPAAIGDVRTGIVVDFSRVRLLEEEQ